MRWSSFRRAASSSSFQRRHAAHFLVLTETARPHLDGPDELGWFDRLERDHDNLRAALRWAIEREDAEVGMRLAGGLCSSGYLAATTATVDHSKSCFWPCQPGRAGRPPPSYAAQRAAGATAGRLSGSACFRGRSAGKRAPAGDRGVPCWHALGGRLRDARSGRVCLCTTRPGGMPGTRARRASDGQSWHCSTLACSPGGRPRWRRGLVAVRAEPGPRSRHRQPPRPATCWALGRVAQARGDKVSDAALMAEARYQRQSRNGVRTVHGGRARRARRRRRAGLTVRCGSQQPLQRWRKASS